MISAPGKAVVQPAPLLGGLLNYPDQGYFARLHLTHEQLLPVFPVLAKKVGEFREAVKEFSLGDLEEHYTKTFDLSPECVPYVGIQTFGEQENKRRWLLCGLSDRYEAASFLPGNHELPDHIAVVLTALPSLTREERRDLVNLCLVQGVKKMAESLEKTRSPYALLMQAVTLYLPHESLENNP